MGVDAHKQPNIPVPMTPSNKPHGIWKHKDWKRSMERRASDNYK